jgi:hypothetical protein
VAHFESDPGIKKLDDAFANAAGKAAQHPENDDKLFQATIQVRITKNPGIKEYKISLDG